MGTAFQIVTDPIDILALRVELEHQSAGANVSFEGWVRDHSDGRSVAALDYEAYPPVAEKEGQLILTEAVQRFELLTARCQHRAGQLAIGDCAVWVGVSSAHRGAAFDACRYIIDEVKSRVPIWKKEHYVDGASGWINCLTGQASEPG
jgi:molybdopterin synthase catalytic subunit